MNFHSNFDRSIRSRHRLAVGIVSALSVVVLATSCAPSVTDTIVIGGSTDDAAAPPVPSFASPTDAGDAETSVDEDASSTAKMCVTSECPPLWASCLDMYGQQPKYRCSTSVANDVNNCGACGYACPYLPFELHMAPSCVDGQCQASCNPVNYRDCNGIADDGCEVDPTTDPNNCGDCGNKCDPGVRCIKGRCGCPPGTVDCNGTCTDTRGDDKNCGACGYACADHEPDGGTYPDNMVWGCENAQCGVKCQTTSYVFWADCNGTKTDGCEINLQSDPMNCAACGHQCDPGDVCYGTYDTPIDCHDAPGKCKGNETFCGSDCRDLDNDAENCGSCGFSCPFPNDVAWERRSDFTRVCNGGRCDIECKEGVADCNGRYDDGCEVDLSKDPHNCGACGVSCDNAVGQPCVAGRCATVECDGGPGTVQ